LRGRSRPCSRSQASRSASRASRGRWRKPTLAAAAPDRLDQPSMPGSISHIGSESGPMYSATPWVSSHSAGACRLVLGVRPPHVTARSSGRTADWGRPRCRCRWFRPAQRRAATRPGPGHRPPASARPGCQGCQGQASALAGHVLRGPPSSRSVRCGHLVRRSDQAWPPAVGLRRRRGTPARRRPWLGHTAHVDLVAIGCLEHLCGSVGPWGGV